MKIGEITSVAAPREVVWQTLTDPEKVTRLMPDGEITASTEDTWRARLAPQTALGKSPFDFTFKLADERPGERVEVTGHGYGSQHVVDLTASLELRDDGDSGTLVEWEADVRLGGVLASLGQRSLPYVVRRQVEQVLKGVEERDTEASRAASPAGAK